MIIVAEEKRVSPLCSRKGALLGAGGAERAEAFCRRAKAYLSAKTRRRYRRIPRRRVAGERKVAREAGRCPESIGLGQENARLECGRMMEAEEVSVLCALW